MKSIGIIVPDYELVGTIHGSYELVGELHEYELDTTNATATAEDILEGKVAYARGNKVIGKLKKITGKFTKNGVYPAPADSVYESVEVSVKDAVFNVQSKTVNPTEEVQTVIPDEGFDGLTSVTVSAIQTEVATATKNGTYESSPGRYLKRVQVKVPQGDYTFAEDAQFGGEASENEPAEYIILRETLDGLADSINSKVGTDYEFSPAQMKEAIDSVTLQDKTVEPAREDQTVTADGEHFGLKSVKVKGVQLQKKQADPGTAEQVVKPDEGYMGLESVTVKPVSLQTKTVKPTTEEQTVEPDDGFDGLGRVTVEAPWLHEVHVYPTAEPQTITPDEGYLGISQVNVHEPLLQDVLVYPEREEQIIKPAEGFVGISQVTVAEPLLQEIYVFPLEEEQVITPADGFLGLSKVTIGAAEPGGGDIVIDGGAAEDTTFGDNWYNVPTGNYDYSAGADAEPSYIPEIPGEGYKALFSKKKKMGRSIKFQTGSYKVELSSSEGDFYVYAVWGRIPSKQVTLVWWLMYAESSFSYRYKSQSSGNPTTDITNRTTTKNGFPGYWGKESFMTISALYDELPDGDIPKGIPLFSLGDFADSTAFEAAARALATSDDTEMGDEQFIAFVSDTQILYDGSVINNMDTSPMTIYECNAEGANAWTQIGTTDGTDYPVGAYTLVWNSHDLKDMECLYVTQSKSDDPIAEMSEGDIGIPVERNETYTIEGPTVNAFVSAAQKVTGGKIPQTPHDAALALDEYYNHPAEGMKW